jgi:hypothetical protein
MMNLNFDFESINGQKLRKAIGYAPLNYDDGSVSFDTIEFVLEDCSLYFSVDDDTDEIICSKKTKTNRSAHKDEDWVSIDPFSKYIDAEIGWLWIGKNYLGYNDLAAVSFEGIIPTILLLGMASKIGLYQTIRL